MDLIPLGIIERVDGQRYTVNKILYKSYLEHEDKLEIGDIILTCDSQRNNEEDRIYNILFFHSEYRFLAKFHLKRYLYEKRKDLPDEIEAIIDKTIDNRAADPEISSELGYGLIGYYFFKRLAKKHPKLCYFGIFLSQFLFAGQFKYYLIICDLFTDHYQYDKYGRYITKLLLISAINFRLFDNYAILIPLLFELYQLIDFPISFMNYLCFLESILFCRIDLLGVFLFRYLISLRTSLFLSSLICLLFPFTDQFLLFLVKIYSFFNKVHIDIRGRISILTILFFLMIIHVFQIRKPVFQTILIIVMIISPLNDPLFHITFIDVGQGDATLIKYPFSKHAILIDTGSSYNYRKLQKYLFAEGLYEIQHLIITHPDEDHDGNIANLQKDFLIRNIITEGNDFEYKNIQYHYLPAGDYDNENDNSLVYLLHINGYKILFTGDISSQVEKQLIRRYGDLDVDILKVSHHGSKTASSDYFISHIRPEFAFISTSGMYYHPHYQTLNTLKRYGCRYFITRDSGNIYFYFSRLIDFIRTDKNEFVIMR